METPKRQTSPDASASEDNASTESMSPDIVQGNNNSSASHKRNDILASPVEFTKLFADSSSESADNKTETADGFAVQISTEEAAVISNNTDMKEPQLPCLEWVGTSELFLKTCMEMQNEGKLDAAILRRTMAVCHISETPYNPAVYVELSYADFNLGFHDVAVASAYKAILLVEAALSTGLKRFPLQVDLRIEVQKAVIKAIQTYHPNVILVEIEDTQRKAYRALLNGLLGCGAFWDGLVEAKKALRRYPGDHDLLELRSALKDGFRGKMGGYTDIGVDGDDLRALTRWGKIYQKPYPWLDPKLNMRTPKLVELINEKFGAENCEIRPVVFGPAHARSTPAIDSETHSSASSITSMDIDTPSGVQIPDAPSKSIRPSSLLCDVGPLGVFATQDIEAGEIVMVDECITGISPMLPREMEHCDACHATLQAPYQNPANTIKPSCCGKVAFCSQKCFSNAKSSYHKVICGKNFDWVYQEEGNGVDPRKFSSGTRWRPIMFLRIMAIILADKKYTLSPLLHPLVARMGANYPSSGTLPEDTTFWQYFENVEAPTRILLQLGVDVFANPDYASEIVTTIYWRMENNASMSSINLSPVVSTTEAESGEARQRFPHLTDQEYHELNVKDAVHMVCLNPQYLFFNHSCEPNISWHGAIPDPSVDIFWLMGYEGEIHPVGSSTVFCRAARDIKKDEELKISYIGDPMGKRGVHKGISARQSRQAKRDCLQKWFPNGCGCRICEEENAAGEGKSPGEETDVEDGGVPI